MSAPIVRLTREEVAYGALVGVHRQTSAIFRGARETVSGVGENGLGWTRHVEAALAELALAKFLDRFWDGAGDQRFRGSKLGDVGRFQARSTSERDGHLIVRPHDSDADVFVLIVGSAPSFTLVGWTFGRDAKRPEFRCDPGGRGAPCFFVPQSALRPVHPRSAAA